MQNFNLYENEFGYLLENGNLKYLLYKSKKVGKGYAPFFLKQVTPYEKYISGMYVEKQHQQKFNGKFENFSVVIILHFHSQTASVYFNDRNKSIPTNKQRNWKHKYF